MIELTIITRGPAEGSDERAVRLSCSVTDDGADWAAFVVRERKNHDPDNDITDQDFLRCASADDWARLSEARDDNDLKRTSEIDVLVPEKYRSGFIDDLKEDLAKSEEELDGVITEDTDWTGVELTVPGTGPYYMPYEEPES